MPPACFICDRFKSLADVKKPDAPMGYLVFWKMAIIRIQRLCTLFGNEHPNAKGVHFVIGGSKNDACILLFKQLDKLEFTVYCYL